MFEQRILLLHDARLHYQQNEQHYAERLELLGVLAVDYALCLTLLELRKLVVQFLLSVVGVVYMDVCATTGTGYVTTRIGAPFVLPMPRINTLMPFLRASFAASNAPPSWSSPSVMSMIALPTPCC